MAERWVLPPLWFDLCWEIGGFDERPYPIAVPVHGDTVQERAVLTQRTTPEMRATGLLAGDTLAPTFARALAAIAKPGLWIEGVWTPDEVSPAPVRLLSVAAERSSVLLVQEPGESDDAGGDLSITLHPDTPITAAALYGMPPTPAGSRPRVAVPRSDLTGGAENGDSGWMRSGGATPTRDQRAVQAFHDLVRTPHLRDGQLTANLRDRNGRRRRSPIFTWFDTTSPEGRYGLDEQQRPGIEPDLVVTPLHPSDVRGALDRRVDRIRSG